MSSPPSLIAIQRQLLVRLAHVEKCQSPGVIVCSAMRFADDAVFLSGGDVGGDRILALNSSPLRVHEAVQSMWTLPLNARSALADEYPSRLDLASCWAELHYDLGRTSYLDEIDDSIRFNEISLAGGNGLISVSSLARGKRVQVTVALDQGEAPIHIADEISEMLDRASGG